MRIEIEWELNSDDADENNTDEVDLDNQNDADRSYEVELKLMYKDGFVNLHDIEIDAGKFESFALPVAGELTMHRDNHDESLFYVDDAATMDVGTGSIKFVGYMIEAGLIDISG